MTRSMERSDGRLRRGAARGLLALLALPAAGMAQEAGVGPSSPEPITLEEAIERALVLSPQMAQSQAGVVTAEAGRRNAYGSFLPSLSASSGASLRSSESYDDVTGRLLSGASDSYNAGLSLAFDVFNGGRRFSELERSRADVRAAEARLQDQTFQVVFQTQTAFFNALRQEDLLEVARSRVRRAEEGLEFVRRQVMVGAATRSDTLRSRLELINARQAVLEAEAGTRTARFALGRQVGAREPVAPVRPDDLEPAPLPLTYGEVLELAEEASPAVRAAQAETAVARATHDAARTAYLPNLSLSGGYDWANQQAAFDGGRTSWSTRLSLSYPIFNGFQRETQIQRTGEQARVARVQEADQRLFARQEADAAYQSLLTSEQALEIAREALEVAAEDLRVVQERYRVGVATILEVITSQVAVDEAAADLVTARYDYVLARAELESILGREL